MPFFLLLLGSFLGALEPSAFNAGGDTPPKSDVQILDEKFFNLSAKVKSIEEFQEGLKSVFEGQLQKMQETSNRLDEISNKNNLAISAMQQHVDNNFALQNENIQKLQEGIIALRELIEKTNAETKAEINALKEEIDKVEANIHSLKEIQQKADFEGKIPAEIFKEAQSLFEQKKYDLASQYLQKAIELNYKPARSNFLLGEISFYQEDFQNAISYYKASAVIYDKADYMPKLMLNSAKSFIKINDKENAKKFLENLIALYPASNEAKEAKGLLQ